MLCAIMRCAAGRTAESLPRNPGVPAGAGQVRASAYRSTQRQGANQEPNSWCARLAIRLQRSDPPAANALAAWRVDASATGVAEYLHLTSERLHIFVLDPHARAP